MEDRDVSEQIALGLPAKKTGDGLFDQRLFGQNKGMDSGFDRKSLNISYFNSYYSKSLKKISFLKLCHKILSMIVNVIFPVVGFSLVLVFCPQKRQSIDEII